MTSLHYGTSPSPRRVGGSLGVKAWPALRPFRLFGQKPSVAPLDDEYLPRALSDKYGKHTAKESINPFHVTPSTHTQHILIFDRQFSEPSPRSGQTLLLGRANHRFISKVRVAPRSYSVVKHHRISAPQRPLILSPFCSQAERGVWITLRDCQVACIHPLRCPNLSALVARPSREKLALLASKP